MMQIMEILKNLYKMNIATPETVGAIAYEYAATKDFKNLYENVASLPTSDETEETNLFWILDRLYQINDQRT